jgi:hypothetical protein
MTNKFRIKRGCNGDDCWLNGVRVDPVEDTLEIKAWGEYWKVTMTFFCDKVEIEEYKTEAK